MEDTPMNRVHKWIVDQVDLGWVKLCSQDVDDLEISLPLNFLPAEINEGQVLNLQIMVDDQATEAALADVLEMVEVLSVEDDGGDFDL